MSKSTESRQIVDAKVRSIRATDEVYDKFKGIVDEFANSNEALGSLITTWEMQQARAILTTREMDITDFNSHVRSLQEAFVHSLELQENTETRVRQEFQTLLTSKDEIISELQERAKAAEDEKKNLEVYCRDAEKSLKAVRDKADADIKLTESEKAALQERLNAAEETIKQRDETIRDKVQAVELLNDKFQSVAEENESLKQIKDNAEQIQTQLNAKVKECEELKAALSKEQAQAEIDKERAALDAEKAAQAEIKKLMDELQEVRKERSKLEQDNYNLRLQLAKYEQGDTSRDDTEEYPDFDNETETDKPKSRNKSNK